MRFNLDAQRLRDLGLLSLAAISSFATSRVPNSIDSGYYAVTSDCPGAEQSGRIELKTVEKPVESPTTEPPSEGEPVTTSVYVLEGATAFGFPSETLERESPDSMVLKSETRVCKSVLFDQATRSAMFVCYNGSETEVQCTITLEHE